MNESLRCQLVKDVLIEFDFLDVHGLVADASSVLISRVAVGMPLLDLVTNKSLVVFQGQTALSLLKLFPLAVLVGEVNHLPHISPIVLDLLLRLSLLVG